MFLNKKWCRLRFFNIAFFASVMWFWWFSIATHKLEEVFKLDLNLSSYFLYFSLVYFLFILFLYIVKIFINFSDVKSDFFHPVKSNFFPWIWKIFLIFSIWFLSIDTSLLVSKYLWIIWVAIQFSFTVILFRRWILHEIDINSLNPLWFLPVVWNLLAPITWVRLWFIELSWFLFSLGFIMWIVLLVVFINRVIFHNPMPDKLMPTLFILVAPWSVCALSYIALNWWVLSDLSKITFYFSVFIFIMIISKINILSKLKFYMSWWAYSFPMAVLTTSTLVMYHLTSNYFLWVLWVVFYIILIFIILLLLYYTYIGFRKKELCIEEK